MLHVRKPLEESRETVFTNAEDVYTLLKNGESDKLNPRHLIAVIVNKK